MENNIGFIYILENEAMPGLWKIGSSERKDINDRINELYNGRSGVPFPFNIVFVGKVEDHKTVEDCIKKQFKRFRVNPKREFFNIDPEIIKPWLKEKFSVKDVTESINEEYDKTVGDSDKKALVKYEYEIEKRQPKFNLKEMGIEDGEIITYKYNENKKAEVIGNTVKYDGKVYKSMAKLTNEILKKDRGYKVGVSPILYWKYKGKLLKDIKNETMSKKGKTTL